MYLCGIDVLCVVRVWCVRAWYVCAYPCVVVCVCTYVGLMCCVCACVRDMCAGLCLRVRGVRVCMCVCACV